MAGYFHEESLAALSQSVKEPLRGRGFMCNRNDVSAIGYRHKMIAHWDGIARKLDFWKGWGGCYHRRLTEIFQHLIPPGQRVIEIGCSQGDLLAALKPSRGVGVDFSGEMIRRARNRHGDLEFIEADAHELKIKEKFDFIILSDLVNELWDVQTVFSRIRELGDCHSRFVINTYSHLWQLPLTLAGRAGLAKQTLYQNWLTVEDVAGLLHLSDYEMITHREEILFPLPVPFLADFMNRFAVKIWPLKMFALSHFIVAGIKPAPGNLPEAPSVSVIVPARNEEGNITDIMERVPEMGSGTEIVFVEGHSSDHTYQAIERALAEMPDRRCRLYRQTGRGKGDAVRLGFARAEGDILMILDADLTVPPEDLPRFYEVLSRGKGEFVNGVRLVYPMEKEAMRFLNLLGNKFFSLAFTWLLGQPIKDTLCGTKVLWKTDYERIAANRSYFGDFDPFGDFDLLFGAARLNLKICEVPIRYRERVYGTTNIQRWSHGWLLIRMVLFAIRRIKFI